jgi:hypothetical protein
MASNTIRVDALRSLAYGSITGSYSAVGSAFSHQTRTIRLINTTDADVTISFDGTNDNMFLPAGSFILYDATSNRQNQQIATTFVYSVGTKIYAKTSGSPSKGAVYVECQYGQGE